MLYVKSKLTPGPLENDERLKNHLQALKTKNHDRTSKILHQG